ncbi:sprT domain-containing protein [Flavobacteriaceae bacterium]|jgi:SprT protein|nr:sprT domain-containing protein [Flavobacteriaceae bacterium]|tara:strand:- start:311 stop:916 length:606 start_codon:yes stop_codon:yes gene_type:complete
MIEFDILELIPEASHELVKPLIFEKHLNIKIVKVRKTKHGDFKKLRNGSNQITLNHINNKYRFLITLIHELAHFKVYKNIKKRVNPHGVEWKNTYKLLMLPFLNNKIFPNDILSKLATHIKNPSASTDSDTNLVVALNKYDYFNDNKIFLNDLSEDCLFEYDQGKVFLVKRKLRKRYICKELSSGREYLFSPVARIKSIEK